MRILWLNAGLLLPLDKGGKLRTWHLMRHLALRHDITYLSFADGSVSAADREGMTQVCSRLETVPRTDSGKGTLRFYADAARHLLDPVPYAVGKYRSAAYRDRLGALLRTERFDAVVCDFLVPFVNMPGRLPCPGILFTHNVEAEIWRRHTENATNPIARTLLSQQWRRMLRFERDVLSGFDVVLAVSEVDAATFERLYPGAVRRPVQVVQTGVDTTYFSPRPDRERPAHLVFTGSMDWLPNQDGMRYFVGDILPRVRAVEPDVTLSIIGRAPTPAVRKLAEERGVEVTGRVDDIRPHVAAGTVYVAPLRIGGGTRLKIFEAMAMGKAVVSTAVGAEGLPVVPGRDLTIADGPAAFANAIVELIRNPAARQGLGQAARTLVVERYDWSAVAHQFEHALSRTAGTVQNSAAAHQARPAAPSAGRPDAVVCENWRGAAENGRTRIREGAGNRLASFAVTADEDPL